MLASGEGFPVLDGAVLPDVLSPDVGVGREEGREDGGLGTLVDGEWAQLDEAGGLALLLIYTVCREVALVVGHVQPGSPGDEVEGALVVVLPEGDVQRGLPDSVGLVHIGPGGQEELHDSFAA